MNQHLAKAKQYLTIAESGDAKREAYRAAAEEVAAFMAETGASIRDVSSYMDISHGRIGNLVKWRKSGYEAPTPYTMTQEKTQESSTRSTTKRTLRDPARRAKVLDELSIDERAAVAKAAMKQPEVMDRVIADPNVRRAADEDEARRARGRHEAGQKGAATKAQGTPLHQHLWRMLGKFTDWTQGLRVIAADIDDLAGNLTTQEYERLLERHRDLRDHAQANIDLLEARVAEPEDVIDGTARAGARRKLAS